MCAPSNDLPYRDLRVISTTQGFRIFSACEGDARVVVVRPDRRASQERALACLRRFAEGHARVEHPLVAPVARAVLDGDGAHVALRVPAVANGFEVAARLTQRGRTLGYAAADGFVLGVREALEAAHRAPGGPVCLGRCSLANVLFDARGRHWVVGLGHNVAVEDEWGRPDPRVRSFHAPELLVSGDATPMTDYVALLLLARSIITHVELPAAVRRVISGRASGAVDRLVARWLRFTEQRVIAELPARRPPLADALRVAGRLRELLGVSPDRGGLARVARELLDDHDAAAAARPGAWVVGPDASWIERDGARLRLAGTGRAVLVALLDHALWSPGGDLDVWQLFDRAWPGQRASYERGMNRVHAAVSRLRRAGLGELIEHSSQGYRIAASADVVRLPAGDAAA